jgi:hypothetical protein
MLAQISFTDDERAAVKDGSAAVERVVARLANTPTPMGRTPHALAQFADLVALSSPRWRAKLRRPLNRRTREI